MDLAFWGFRHWPFDRTVCGQRPFIGTAHEEAFARLLFLIEERRRCGMITGLAGTGKSCLLRQARSHAERLGRACVSVDATGLDGNELARQVATDSLADVGVSDSPARVWSALQARFASLAIVRQPLVITVDHFDLAELGCSHALRRLMRLADSMGADLTVLIAARERDTSPLQLDAVELHVELSAWSEDETARFLWDTLRRAGARDTIFTAEAIQAVQSLTRGNPGDVVRLCDMALLAAQIENRRQVSAPLIEAAATELFPHRPPSVERFSPLAFV